MGVVASLDVLLRGDSSSLEKSADRSEGSVKRLAGTVSQGASGVSVSFNGMGNVAQQAAARLAEATGRAQEAMNGLSLKSAVVAGVVGGAMAAVSTAIMDAGKKVASAAQDAFSSMGSMGGAALRLGLTTTQLYGLQHAAALAGVSGEDLSHMFARFTRSIAEASHGSAELTGAFGMLGLNVNQLKEMAPDEAFARFAEAIRTTGTAADKVMLTDKILGRGGDKLIPFLSKGSEGIAAMTAAMERLGPVNAAAVADVNKVLVSAREFNEAMQGIGRSLAVIYARVVGSGGLAAMATAVAEWLNTNIDRFTAAAQAALDFGKSLSALVVEWHPLRLVLDTGAEMLGMLSGALQGAGTSWQELGIQIATVANQVLGLWRAWIETGLLAIKTAFGLALAFNPLPAVLNMVGGAMGGLGITWEGVRQAIARGLFSLQWAMMNWQEYGLLAFDKMQLAAVSFGNSFSHFTGITMENLRTFATFAKTAAQTIAAPFIELAKVVGGAAAGMAKGFNDAMSSIKLPPGMAKGFTDALKLTGREPTDLEKELMARIGEREKKLSEGAAEFIKRKMEELDRFDIFGPIIDLFRGKLPGGGLPGLPIPKLDLFDFGLPGGRKPGPDERPGKGTEISAIARSAAAMERGSKEAFSALFGEGGDIAKKAYGVANKQLEETKQLKALLGRILKNMAPGFKKARL